MLTDNNLIKDEYYIIQRKETSRSVPLCILCQYKFSEVEKINEKKHSIDIFEFVECFNGRFRGYLRGERLQFYNNEGFIYYLGLEVPTYHYHIKNKLYLNLFYGVDL
jgi:hypothetical protein